MFGLGELGPSLAAEGVGISGVNAPHLQSCITRVSAAVSWVTAWRLVEERLDGARTDTCGTRQKPTGPSPDPAAALADSPRPRMVGGGRPEGSQLARAPGPPPPCTSPHGSCSMAITPATGSQGSGSARSWSSGKASHRRRPTAPQLRDLVLQRPRVLVLAAATAPQPPPTPAVTSCDGLLQLAEALYFHFP